MAITMTNYGLTWTDAEGVPRASRMSYDRASAEQRKARLEAEGCTEVDVVQVKPGVLPEAKG